MLGERLEAAGGEGRRVPGGRARALPGRRSSGLGRTVAVISEPPAGARYRTLPLAQVEGDETEMPLINGFFDTMPLHLLATGTLAHLGSLYPEGRFEVERFRPNVLIETPAGGGGFVDNGWIGKTQAMGGGRRGGVGRVSGGGR